MSGQAGRYQRSAAGMVGAMVVLVAIIIGFVVLRDANRRDLPSPVKDVDYAQAAEYARGEAGFTVLAPPSLPDGWRATTAGYVGGANERWHVGMLTDGGRYVGLEQSGGSVDSMVVAHVDEGATPGDPVTVGDEQWDTFSDDGGDLALVREEDGTTTLVVGHEVPVDVLAELAATLR